MRFSLRTLLVVMLITGPLAALCWEEYLARKERVEQEKAAQVQWQSATLITRQVGTASNGTSDSSGWQVWEKQGVFPKRRIAAVSSMPQDDLVGLREE